MPKIQKSGVDFSILKEIFQFFRENYLLLISDGENIEMKISGKNPLRNGFQEIVEKAYKNAELQGKKGRCRRAESPGLIYQ